MSESNYWDRWQRNRLSRRGLLRTSGFAAAGLGAAAFVGCGDDDDDSGSAPTSGATTSSGNASPAASGTAAAAPKPTGSINVSVATLQEQSTSPFFQTGGLSYPIYNSAFESFYMTNLEGRSEPRLAESMEVIDPQTLRFKLRKGITFSDGTPVTADDIKWSFDAYVNNDPPAGPSVRLKKSVEKMDVTEDSVTIKFTIPVPFGMEEFGVTGHARGWPIAQRAAFEKMGDAWKSAPVTTGPYKVTKNAVGQFVELEANENYYNPAFAAHVKTVRLNIVPEQQTRLAQIKTGEADIIEGIIGPAAESLKSDSNIKIVDTKNTAQLTIRFEDLWDSPFKGPQADIRFREALVISVDQEQVAKNLLKLGSPSPNILIFPNSSGFDPSFTARKRDVARAKQLMKEAGAEGQKMRLGAYKSSSYPLIPEVMQAYSGYWKEIGLETTIEEKESGTYFTEFQKHTPRGLGPISFPNFSNGAILLVTYYKTGAPYSTTDNFPEIQDVIKQLESEFDSKKQEELIKQGMKFAYDNFLFIPCPYVDSLWATGKKVKDWKRQAGIPYMNTLNTVTI